MEQAIHQQLPYGIGPFFSYENISSCVTNVLHKEKIKNYLNISKGSCSEVRNMLYLCLDRKFCTQEQFESLKAQAIQISSQLYIYKLIAYLKQ